MLSGHDVSDGGLVTALLEMCFAGMHGTTVNVISSVICPIHVLFAEEVGWLLEVRSDQELAVTDAFKAADVPIVCIGSTGAPGMDAKVGFFFFFLFGIISKLNLRRFVLNQLPFKKNPVTKHCRNLEKFENGFINLLISRRKYFFFDL